MGTSLRTVDKTTLFGTETCHRRLGVGDFIEIEFKPRAGSEGEGGLSLPDVLVWQVPTFMVRRIAGVSGPPPPVHYPG